MSLDFVCRMAAKYGSESGQCACKHPKECPFTKEGQSKIREFREMLDAAKKTP